MKVLNLLRGKRGGVVVEVDRRKERGGEGSSLGEGKMIMDLGEMKRTREGMRGRALMMRDLRRTGKGLRCGMMMLDSNVIMG